MSACPAVSVPWKSAPTVAPQSVMTALWSAVEIHSAVSAMTTTSLIHVFRKPVQNERNPYPASEKFFQR
jgi:hypothetical protein